MRKIVYTLPLLILSALAIQCGSDRMGSMLVDAGNAMRDGGAVAAPTSLRWESFELECDPNDPPSFLNVPNPNIDRTKVRTVSLVACSVQSCSAQRIIDGFLFMDDQIVTPKGTNCDLGGTFTLTVGIAN